MTSVKSLPRLAASSGNGDKKTDDETKTSLNEAPTKKSKSRNGCRGCKARRLKCDEQKPACANCLRRGRQCPGYARDFKFSTKHEKLRPISKPVAEKWKPTPRLPTKADEQIADPQTKVYFADCDENNIEPDEPDRTEELFDSTIDLDQVLDHAPEASPTRISPSPQDGSQLTWTELLSSATRTEIDLAKDSSQPPYSPELDEIDAEQEPADDLNHHDEESINIDFLSLVRKRTSSKQPSGNQLIRNPSSRVSSNPVDLPTTLIEYWFTHVCSMWSAYDSETNPNRQLALSTCFNSEPVFYALQSMAAACLVDSLPHLKPVLATTSSQALAAISRDMDVYRNANSSIGDSPPTDLLLATFAMATSLCWADTKQLGEPLVVGAKTILSRYAESDGGLDDFDQKNLSHFRHALKYTEMLLNFVNTDSAHGDLESMRKKHRQRLRQAMNWKESKRNVKEEGSSTRSSFGPFQDADDSMLHPWTGISLQVQERFGLAMALCRDYHVRRRTTRSHSAEAMCEALCDIEVARELTNELLDADFSSTGAICDPTLLTGDAKTTLDHLVDTAEAYRIAALQQLYITFPDLEVSLEHDTASPHSLSDLPRDEALTALTLHLVDVLQRIPADSGTRCIQPVLFVSAATGLKFDTPVTTDPYVMPLTQCTIEVSRARQFIIDRLGTLLRSLPPRPISVALNLVKAIWSEYDYGGDGGSDRHWMDVMMSTGLQTLFG